jgi:demethylmenaquinone methyltransferase/2-methoxy-6-polyprenyl-1,4-benzoquinol methylase
MVENKSGVKKMFAAIAPRYDLLNRLMTFGQDLRWRRKLVRGLPIPEHPLVLDIGCGTGDLAREVRVQHPAALVIAADFTAEMVQLGAENNPDPGIQWVIADAGQLPFKDEVFQAVVCGYLLRNVPDVDRALQEQYRVSQPGGWAASLDTTPPQENWLRPLIEFHLNRVIPLLGRLVLGDPSAYRYLSDSTQQFLDAEQLASKYRKAGFQSVSYLKMMLRTMAIHQARKERLKPE